MNDATIPLWAIVASFGALFFLAYDFSSFVDWWGILDFLIFLIAVWLV
jgi:hypothetical protein